MSDMDYRLCSCHTTGSFGCPVHEPPPPAREHLCARCREVPPAEDSFGYCRLCLMLIDLGPFSREPIPEQDIERAGELAVERGWEDMGGVQAELAEAKDAWDEWYEIAALRLRRAEAAEQTIQQLRAALLDAEAQLTQGSGSPECHYALGIIRAALTTDTTEPSGD